MAPRLPLDQHVLAYFGFDEANVADAALDESAAGRDLAVTAAAGVVQARLGNGRQFDGAATKALLANPAHDAAFRLFGATPATILCWVTLDSALSSGSQRRTIVCFEGATSAAADHTLFSLSVDAQGAIHYEQQDDLGNWTNLATAVGTIRTGRYYSLALVRELVVSQGDDDAQPVQNHRFTLYVNNALVPWASVLYCGAPTGAGTLPVASQYATTSRLCVGHSKKRTDAYWHGVVDELSIHDAARVKSPYLDSVYFRLALASAVTKLTTEGDIRAVGGAEMGGGSRWWVYERDHALYVIRENSLGLFSKEILLTSGGVGGVYTVSGVPTGGAPIPPGNERPVVSYDAVNDRLVVAFVSSGRVFKVTATSSDAPVTQAMPATADSAAIVKLVDSADLTRQGAGEPQRPAGYIDGTAVPTNVGFFYIPSFGLTFEGSNPQGYAVFQSFAGLDRFLGTVMSPLPGPERTCYYLAIPVRQYGAAYFVIPYTKTGALSKNLPAPIVDFEGGFTPTNSDPNYLFWNRAGDALVDDALASAGSPLVQAFAQNTTTPLKMPIPAESASDGAGDPVAVPRDFAQFTTTPLKLPLPAETATNGLGGGSRAVLSRTNGPEVSL